MSNSQERLTVTFNHINHPNTEVCKIAAMQYEMQNMIYSMAFAV